MNEDLLKRVAACAPEEWIGPNGRRACSRIRWDLPIEGYGVEQVYLSFDRPDALNAQAIVVMLDAMEKEGERPSVQKMYPDRATPFVCDMTTFGSYRFCGETRCEAVALAFCEVFEKDKP